MEVYQINDLERLSGIKAHTIRIWEKRYELISPHRTQTNIRYYDDQQVKKLLNVATLLDAGWKISKVAALSPEAIKQEIHAVLATATDDFMVSSYINEMIIAMLAFDELSFDKMFSAAVNRLGMFPAVVKVFYPFLHRTGVLWSIDEVMPVQEHFACNLVRKKLLAAIDGIPPASRNDKKFLLFLPADEWHEISLLFADYLVRSKGYPSVYLGQNVPYNDLDYVLQRAQPSHILSFVIGGDHRKNMNLLLEKLTADYPGMVFMVSGNKQLLENLNSYANVIILNEPQDILKIL